MFEKKGKKSHFGVLQIADGIERGSHLNPKWSKQKNAKMKGHIFGK